MSEMTPPKAKDGVRSYTEFEQARRLDSMLREHNARELRKTNRSRYFLSLNYSIGAGAASTLILQPVIWLCSYFSQMMHMIPAISFIYFFSFTSLSVSSKTLKYLTSKSTKF